MPFTDIETTMYNDSASIVPGGVETQSLQHRWEKTDSLDQ
jgi:hypothetical protein